MSVQGGRPHRDVAVAGDAASLHSFSRLWRHYEAELANDLAAVMKTVVADDNAFGTPIFWAVNADPEELGAKADRPKATIIPGYAGAYRNYESLFRNSRIQDIKIVLQICGGWWVFHQVVMEIIDGDARPATIECVVIIRTDADEDGISGELGWVLDGVVPPAGQDAADRFGLIRRYARDLGASDLDMVMAMMTEDVQGVVRDYADPGGGPVLADGAVAMRAAYENLMARGTVRAARPVAWSVSDPRYVFVDLHLELESGDGSTLATRLVEYLVLSEDGRFAARFGWSTPF